MPKYLCSSCKCKIPQFLKDVGLLHLFSWLSWAFIAALGAFSSCSNGGSSLPVVLGLLTAVASLVAEHAIFRSSGSRAPEHRLNSHPAQRSLAPWPSGSY